MMQNRQTYLGGGTQIGKQPDGKPIPWYFKEFIFKRS